MELANQKEYNEEEAEKRVDRLMAEYYKRKYPTFESFKKDFYEKIEQAQKDVEEGRCRPFEEFRAEMEAKYHLNEL